jgi:hypothetical protein
VAELNVMSVFPWFVKEWNFLLFLNIIPEITFQRKNVQL